VGQPNHESTRTETTIQVPSAIDVDRPDHYILV
jgi:hypothetical protein